MSLYIHIILRLIYYCFYSPYVHIVFQHWSILPHPALDRGKAWRGLWSQRIGLRALQMFGGPGPGSKWLVWHKKETMGRGFQDLPSVMVLFTCPNLPSVTCSYWFIYGFILECLAVSCAWTIVMHGTRGSAAKCDQSWSVRLGQLWRSGRPAMFVQHVRHADLNGNMQSTLIFEFHILTICDDECWLHKFA